LTRPVLALGLLRLRISCCRLDRVQLPEAERAFEGPLPLARRVVLREPGPVPEELLLLGEA
jgi:hypothetical protein